MKTKEIEKELEPKKNKPTTLIENEKGETIEVDFEAVLMNLDKLTSKE